MVLNLDNDKIRSLIPNVIHEVEGETPLYFKIRPWIESAKLELEDIYIGSYEPDEALANFIETIIVRRAFARAIPSLDLSISPGGFTVINTDGRAPASKERVERLIASLDSYCDANIPVLIKHLALKEQWRDSTKGKWWLATFIPNLDNVSRFKGDKDLHTAYCLMRDLAIVFEHEIANRFLGKNFLAEIRSSYPNNAASDVGEIYQLIASAELRFIQAHFRDQKNQCPNKHEIWHLASPIIAHLDYFPELKAKWADEMGEVIKVEPFKNKVKGGYFF